MRRHHVGLLALFVALGGTAYAVTAPKNSVTSKSIRANAVRSPDIKANAVRAAEVAPGAIGAAKLATAQTFEFPTQETILDDESPVTNAMTVQVPASGVVEMLISAEIRMTNDAGGFCSVGIDFPPATNLTVLPVLSTFTEGANFFRWRSAPGTGGEGATSAADAGFIALAAQPGAQTFRLAYTVFNANSQFRNANVTVLPAA